MSVDLEFCEILWHLGDFVSRSDDSQEYMFKIFRQLKELSVYENREVRHTMLHILSTLLQHNCSKYGHEFWASVFEEIFYPIMQEIISCYYEKLASNDRDSTSWQFTAKTLVRTSNKLFKRFLGFNEKSSSQKLLNYHFKMMATLLNQL